MSLKPGLGTTWFKKHWQDIYRLHDKVLHDKKMLTPPKRYDTLLEQMEPELWEDIKIKRILDAAQFDSERTPERLAAREIVALAMHQQKESQL